MIDTKALRQKILDMAIRGQLVPQDENDEPASVLLEKIRAEKQRLIKEGKVKEDKNESIIFKGDDNRYYEKIGNEIKDITGEINFSLPTGWELARLCLICWLGDIRVSSGEILPYLDAKTLRGKTKASFFANGKVVNIGMKVILVDGENSGEVFDVPYRGYMGSTFKILDVNSFFNARYLNQILDYYKDTFRDNKTGSAIPHLNKTLFRNLLIGVPPLAEQERIVNRVEKLLAQVGIIDKNQNDIEVLYEDLKKRTLDLAIQGKLVPQDVNDEPASVLLEKIRAEKKAQLGKKYIDSYIYKGDDNCYYEKVANKEPVLLENLPFDIPDSWEWARLGGYITLLSGRDLEPSQYNDNTEGIPYITGASNFNNGILLVNRWTTSPMVISKLGDLLLTCKGTIGAMAYNDIGELHIARQVMAINSSIYPLYVEIYLKTKIEVLKAQAKSFIPGISRSDIEQSLIPIPPSKEQIRMCNRLKLLLDCMKDEN